MSTQTPPVIDAQVHAYERNHPARPWAGHLAGPAEVTGDDMVAAMDEVGVDGALLISPWSLYRFDASYALEVHARHAGRFGLIKPFDPASPSVAEEIAEWARTPGAVGARIVLWHDQSVDAADPGLERILKAGAAHDLPINILAWERLALFDSLARAHPDTQLVLDHLGLRQPFTPPVPAQPFDPVEGHGFRRRDRNDRPGLKVDGQKAITMCDVRHAVLPARGHAERHHVTKVGEHAQRGRAGAQNQHAMLQRIKQQHTS